MFGPAIEIRTHWRSAAVIIVILLATIGQAQAASYAYANSEKSAIILKWGATDVMLKAALEVAKKGGNGWFRLIGSETPGNGAIYCVSRSDGADPHYFVSEGRATLGEALRISHVAANSFASGKRGMRVYVCGTYKNSTRVARLPAREIDEGGERLLIAAKAIVEAEIARDEKRLRLIDAVEAAVSADPRVTASTQAEAVAKFLLDSVGLNASRQLEADADAAYRHRRIEETKSSLENR